VFLKNLWVKSIFFKLATPILGVGIVLAAFVFVILSENHKKVEEAFVRELAENFLETLIVATQTDASQENFIRMINALSVNQEVDSMVLLDPATRTVVAGSKNQYIGKSSSEIRSQLALKVLDSESFTPGTFDVYLVDDVYHTHSIFKIYANDSRSIKEFELHIGLKKGSLSKEFSNTLDQLTLFFVLNLTVLVVLFSIVVRKVLVTRLKRLLKLISDEIDKDFASLYRDQGDTIDEITSMFKDMLWLKKVAEQESNRALTLATKSNQAKGQFLSNMTHEFKTPLNSIIGFSQRVMKSATGLEGRQLRALETIHQSGENLLELVNTVLTLSRIDNGEKPLQWEFADISELVQGALTPFGELSEEKGLEWKVELEPSLSGTIDSAKLKKVIANLVDNALKYTDSGSITVHFGSMDDNLCVLSVADTGRGIKPEDFAKLYQRFQRLEEQDATSIGQGAGLGLAVVKAYVELMGGCIDQESVYGEGSKFLVYLPLKD